MKIRMWLAAMLAFSNVYAANTDFDRAAQQVLVNHFNKYKDQEYFSGVSLSIAAPNAEIRNYYQGNITHGVNSKPVDKDTLFEIGSITKSFTAALMLQLEKEKKLSMQDTVAKYLPQYAKWGKQQLNALLNMTSCLPNYSDSPLLNTAFFKDTTAIWSAEDLIGFVYPRADFTPPLRTGYLYSNTGYALADMIIAKQTNSTYKDELQKRLIVPANLHNTFYPIPTMSDEVAIRMAHGYGYNQYTNPELVGVDVFNNNLSWAGAAGGLVATTEDVIKWVQALFMGDHILDAKQKQAMMTVVSTKTGKPITRVSADNRQSFGLGVAGIYNEKFPKESMWFYEGSTIGFRVIYFYVPCNKVIVAAAFNSSVDGENDHAHDLLQDAYALLIKKQPALRCH